MSGFVGFIVLLSIEIAFVLTFIDVTKAWVGVINFVGLNSFCWANRGVESLLGWWFPEEAKPKVAHGCFEAPLGEIFQSSICHLFLCGFLIAFSVGLFLGVMSSVVDVKVNAWIASAFIVSVGSSVYFSLGLKGSIGLNVLISGLDLLVVGCSLVFGFCWGLLAVNCVWLLVSQFGTCQGDYITDLAV